jgi:Spy/CpxP family protein refolding chaperone
MQTPRTNFAIRGTAALGLVLGVVSGCARTPTAPAAEPAETETTSSDEAAADLAEHDSHHHYGGLAMLVAMSLESLSVDAGQQPAVNDIRADLYKRMQPARAAEQALLEALADGVAADLIDAVRVEDALGRLTPAADGLSQPVAADLGQLHSILKPEQRAALVDKVEAHWAVWQRANGSGDDSGGAPRRGRLDRLDRLTRELSLTSAQVERVRSALSSPEEQSRPMAFEEIEARVRALDTFRGDSFDPSDLASEGPSAHLASWGAARMAHFFEALSPVLTSDQRTKVSGLLRAHAHDTEEQQPS